MYQLTAKNISSWTREGTTSLPSAIDVICPDCGRLVTFTVTKWIPTLLQSRVAAARCPRCHQSELFIILEHSGKTNGLTENERLFISKAPPGREPMQAILKTTELSDSVQRAYLSAINVYNTREWGATAVLVRRLLEGITKSLLDPQYQDLPLAQQVEKLPSVKNLSEPITTIADAIRKGGNLGAHFDLEAEPNKEVATLMLDLVEELIEYFYVLPARIEHLHANIETLSNKEHAVSPNLNRPGFCGGSKS